MVAREFQSYTSKRSVDIAYAVDVVDAAEAVVAIQWKLSKMPPPPPGDARKSAAAEDLAMPLSGN